MDFSKIKSLPIAGFVLQTRRNTVIALIILGLTGILGWQKVNVSSRQPQYQTAQAEKGTLVSSVTASGQVTSANNVTITIQVSGVVNTVYVKNGATVTLGQKIADLTLDQASQQKQAAALASYLSSKATLDAANSKLYGLQSTMFSKWQTYMDLATNSTYQNGDSSPNTSNRVLTPFTTAHDDWLQAEADYKNQQGVISEDQAALSSTSLSLSQTSSNITSPAAGVIKGLTITPGAIVTVTSSSSNATSVSQVLGSVYQQGPIQAEVDISEIDSVNVSEGQKVTMTLDAFPNATYTGKVASINTNGVVSSGVTTYPAIISFDTGNDHIYPNMAVTAKIITNVKNNVVLVPSAAVQTRSGQSTVRIMKNSTPTPVFVEVGDSNDTQTEITSGISEGDTVVIGTSNAGGGGATSSPFGAFRGFGGFRGRGGGG
jgi:macrolide-specific efflux system membrane fusion protein